MARDSTRRRWRCAAGAPARPVTTGTRVPGPGVSGKGSAAEWPQERPAAGPAARRWRRATEASDPRPCRHARLAAAGWGTLGTGCASIGQPFHTRGVAATSAALAADGWGCRELQRGRLGSRCPSLGADGASAMAPLASWGRARALWAPRCRARRPAALDGGGRGVLPGPPRRRAEPGRGTDGTESWPAPRRTGGESTPGVATVRRRTWPASSATRHQLGRRRRVPGRRRRRDQRATLPPTAAEATGSGRRPCGARGSGVAVRPT